MTQQAMRRTIEKVRQDLVLLKPKPPVHIVLRGKPPDSASAAAKAAHLVEMAELEAQGIKVILLVGVKSKPVVLARRRPSPALNSAPAHG
jgi:hypothetical protein